MITLYERGETGHRPVIMKYVERAFTQSGWRVSLRKGRSSWDILGAAYYAWSSKSKAFFILTADRPFIYYFAASAIARLSGIHVISIYYNYHRMSGGFSGLLWALVMRFRLLSVLFVMDDRIAPWAKFSEAKYCENVRYLPDPWDPTEFKSWEKTEAREKIGVDAGAVVVLCFGELGKRKGVDFFLDALIENMPKRGGSSVAFLFAGRVADDTKASLLKAKVILEERGYDVIIHDKRVDELLVSAYFYAADIVVHPVAAGNEASSGVVVRAVAAGRPVVAMRQGVVGRLLEQAGLGVFFDGRTRASLTDALNRAIAAVDRGWPTHEDVIRARIVSERQSLEVFSSTIVRTAAELTPTGWEGVW